VSRLTRRDILKSAGATGTVGMLAASGCEKAVSLLAEQVGGNTVPESLSLPASAGIDPAHHLLSRAAFGPWPGEVERVKAMGEAAWIENQLAPEKIDDRACAIRVGMLDSNNLEVELCYELERDEMRLEMARATLMRAVYSKRQLFEVMCSFWTDHLNINIEKADCIYLKPQDDREVVRKHAMGRFRDLIRASATSPAMLVYLDGKENARHKPGDVPNENYGRELLELHTLGVSGGYTQKDVYEVARCLTGWQLGKGWRAGTAYCNKDRHDDGEKHVLGHVVPAGQGGEKDLEQVIDIVCRHPSTARFVSKKLVQRFVSEEPPASLVDRVTKQFTETDGQIQPLVKTILTSDEFRASAGKKLKPPFRFVASALRAVAADTHAHGGLVEYLQRMGQGVFQYPTPDGYPDEAAPWLGTLLWRWNFAFSLAKGEVPSVKVPQQKLVKALGGDDLGTLPDRLLRYVTGRQAQEVERAALVSATASTLLKEEDAPQTMLALAIASPAFQRY
jgi:uncharacterized protein (DUF1800 family)